MITERTEMDRRSLELLLDQGESVERIAKRFGKDPSMVSYWMKKYGLTSAYAEKHAARRGIEREQLEGLVEGGLSIAEIAAEVGRSKATVRHWLRRYELTTRGGRRRVARQAGLVTVEMVCKRHGRTTFSSRRGGAIDASGVERKMPLATARNSKPFWWPRLADAVRSAAMTGTSARCSSTIATHRLSGLTSVDAESGIRSTPFARRPANAFCCAETVTWRWKLAALNCR
jgi:transposase